MTILTHAEALLAHHPEGIVRSMGLAYLPGHGLGCCSLVRIFVMALAERIPDVALRGITSWHDWHRLDPAAWDLANLARSTWGPWDALLAAHLELGAGRFDIQLTADQSRPPLGDGLNIVQYWNPAILAWQHGDDIPHGHTVIEILQGDSVRRIQSGRRYAYRDEQGAPVLLPGHLKGVLHLGA